MIIDNGTRQPLQIVGVFDGIAGVVGNSVSFIPNRAGRSPKDARGGVLDGKPILFGAPVKETVGPFWTARFTVPE